MDGWQGKLLLVSGGVWVTMLNGSVLLCLSNTVASHPPCLLPARPSLTGCSQASERDAPSRFR